MSAQVTGSEAKRKAHGNSVLCTRNHDFLIYWIMMLTMMVKKLIIAGDRHRVVPDPPRRGLRRQEGPRVDQAREVDNVDDVDNHDDVDGVDDVDYVVDQAREVDNVDDDDNHDDVDDDDDVDYAVNQAREEVRDHVVHLPCQVF